MAFLAAIPELLAAVAPEIFSAFAPASEVLAPTIVNPEMVAMLGGDVAAPIAEAIAPELGAGIGAGAGAVVPGAAAVGSSIAGELGGLGASLGSAGVSGAGAIVGGAAGLGLGRDILDGIREVTGTFHEGLQRIQNQMGGSQVVNAILGRSGGPTSAGGVGSVVPVHATPPSISAPTPTPPTNTPVTVTPQKRPFESGPSGDLMNSLSQGLSSVDLNNPEVVNEIQQKMGGAMNYLNNSNVKDRLRNSLENIPNYGTELQGFKQSPFAQRPDYKQANKERVSKAVNNLFEGGSVQSATQYQQPNAADVVDDDDTASLGNILDKGNQLFEKGNQIFESLHKIRKLF